MRRASLPPARAGGRPPPPGLRRQSVRFARKNRDLRYPPAPPRRPQGRPALGGRGRKPIAELEIYRPGDEISASGRASTGIGDRMDPNGGRQLESAGVADQPRRRFSRKL